MTARLRREEFLAAAAALAAPGLAKAPSSPPTGWAGVRAQFALQPGVGNFATFLLASHPKPVREAIERHRRGLDANPKGYLDANEGVLEQRARAAAAAYLGSASDLVALTDSTTMGLGLLYGGLRLRAGDEVITSAHDFYATHEALRLQAVRTGVRVRKVELYRDSARAAAQSGRGRARLR